MDERKRKRSCDERIDEFVRLNREKYGENWAEILAGELLQESDEILKAIIKKGNKHDSTK